MTKGRTKTAQLLLTNKPTQCCWKYCVAYL